MSRTGLLIILSVMAVYILHLGISEAGTAEPAKKINGKGYVFTVDTPVAKDGAGKVIFTVRAQKGYKVNKKFPNKLKLKAQSGVELKKSEYKTAEASKIDEAHIEMTAPYIVKSDAKKGELESEFRFGICVIKNGEVVSCTFHKEELKISLPLK